MLLKVKSKKCHQIANAYARKRLHITLFEEYVYRLHRPESKWHWKRVAFKCWCAVRVSPWIPEYLFLKLSRWCLAHHLALVDYKLLNCSVNNSIETHLYLIWKYLFISRQIIIPNTQRISGDRDHTTPVSQPVSCDSINVVPIDICIMCNCCWRISLSLWCVQVWSTHQKKKPNSRKYWRKQNVSNRSVDTGIRTVLVLFIYLQWPQRFSHTRRDSPIQFGWASGCRSKIIATPWPVELRKKNVLVIVASTKTSILHFPEWIK